MKLDAAGNLIRFTYYGDSGADSGDAIAVDAVRDIHLGGRRGSPAQAFVAKLTADLSLQRAITYLGFASVHGVVADALGCSWAVGSGALKAVAGAEQMDRVPASPPQTGLSDAFVAKIRYETVPDPVVANQNQYVSLLEYASYLGGVGEDHANGVAAVDGYAYVIGTTTSADFPRSATPLLATYGGAKDIFLRKTSGDVDGDAIPDAWETPGEWIDINRDGVLDLDLVALGASAKQKDLFIEIDYLFKPASFLSGVHTHRPNHKPYSANVPLALNGVQQPLDAMKSAFLAAPVPIPTGCSGCMSGIAVHYRGANHDGTDDEILETSVNDQLRIAPAGSDTLREIKHGPPPAPGSSAPEPACDGYFGTANDRADLVNCEATLAAWAQVAHYVFFGHLIVGENGIGEVNGNDLSITIPLGPGEKLSGTIGGFKNKPHYGGHEDRVWAEYQAYFLMHELGHNLGLRHGGGTGIKAAPGWTEPDAEDNRKIGCKPNYLSVMNYAFAYPHIKKGPNGSKAVVRRRLNFSLSALPTLDEARLNEGRGLDGPSDWDTIFSAGSSDVAMAPAFGPIDWSGGRQSYNQNLVQADINNISAPHPNTGTPELSGVCGPKRDELLLGHDDWANLFFDFRTSDAFKLTLALAHVEDEPTAEQFINDLRVVPQITQLSIGSHCGADTAPATMIVRAEVYDEDNDVERVEFFINGVKVGEATAAPYQFMWDVVDSGTYFVYATVTDAEGFSSTTDAERTVTFTSGAAPILTIVSPLDGGEFIEGTPIPLTVAVDDSDPCSAAVELYAGSVKIGNGVYAGTTGSTYFVNSHWTAPSVGQHVITARIRQGNVYSSAPVHVTVKQNLPPAVVLSSPLHGETFPAGSEVLLRAEASDTVGSVEKVEWFAGETKIAEQIWSSPSMTYFAEWSAVANGSYVLTARATDSSGAVTVSDPVQITVADNQPPQVSVISPAAGDRFVSSAHLQLSASASDPDPLGSVVSVEWFAGDAKIGEGAFTSASSPLPAGNYLITARATDSSGAVTVSDAVAITVVDNQPPQIQIVSPITATLRAPMAIDVVVEVTDDFALDATGAELLVNGAPASSKTGPSGSLPRRRALTSLRRE
ncbi:MAG TPA: Ig-like domain-containing protein [Thermoanaerobaculia bacterium]|jgi:hypothetical protein